MDAPKSDLQDLRMRANQYTDESLESTRRMLALCDETQDTGAKTLQMLDHQGEQLDRIEEGVDNINSEMRKAEKNLTGMEKCCGLCVLPCSKSAEFKEDAQTWKSNDDGNHGVINNQPRGLNGDRNDVNTSGTGGYIQRIMNDAREDEMDDNMGQVSNMLGNLRNMAIDMGSEIETQNRQLDRINVKADSTANRIDMANQRAEKILKS